MADDRTREPFRKGKPAPDAGPSKPIAPIPLRQPDPPPAKASPTPVAQTSPGERKLMADRTRPRDPGRLASLDAYRGLIMLLLAAGGFGIARFAAIERSSPLWQSADYDLWQRVAFHFNHPAWRSNFLPSFLEGTRLAEYNTEFVRFGVSFWDLIQPAFMFMVGVAMPLSNARRWSAGQSAGRRLAHAAWRSLALVLLGVFLYSTGTERTNWIFTNVLAQIGLGYLVAYLLLPLRNWVQILALGLILVGYWALFKFDPPPPDYDYAAVNASAERGEVYEGRFAPWSKNANAAHRFDRTFLNMLRTIPEEDQQTLGIARDARDWAPEPVRTWLFAYSEPFLKNDGGYQTLNFVPSIGTMLLGVLCGQLLLTAQRPGRKLALLIGGGALCLVLGLAAAQFACPIVKRIWTPSWVLFSGGFVIWMLAAFYLLFDLLPLKKLAFPLAVLGMNSIAIYLMGELLRGWTASHVVRTHLSGFLETILGAEALQDHMYGPIVFATATVCVFWLVALWMYRKGIFLRL